MPFIELDLDSAQEASVVPEGEYDVRCARFEATTSKKGNAMYRAMILVEDPEYSNALPINHFLVLPSADDDQDVVNMKLRNIKRFLACFGVAFEGSGFNDEDVEGATGRCFVGQTPADEDTGAIYNELKPPRIKDD